MKIAIIGGGAAGLMAATTAREESDEAEIFLIEKNDSLGKKVIISGGGRCNLTTGVENIRQVLTNYPRGSKFLSKAMYTFPPKAVRAWFEDHGVKVKTEKDMRVFPCSNDGRDVVRVFEKLFQQTGVKVLFNANVTGITRQSHGFTIKLKAIKEALEVDKVILTTGGQAYRATGSTGDGYAFAQSLGHTITDLAPGLSALQTLEKWPARVSGLSFSAARFSLASDSKITCQGPFIFTHKGISGPAVFALSSLLAFYQFTPEQPVVVKADLFDGMSPDVLLKRTQSNASKYTKKSLCNVLAMLAPKALVEIMLEDLSLEADTQIAMVSKKDLMRCAAWLKAVPLNISARVAGDEFVTAGGVDLAEINPSTMESKICPGLFLAGEILDIDGFTGGFNLQSAWCTGRLAGKSAVNT